MKPGIEKILKALVEHEELTFKQLKDETKLSPPALSEYLKQLILGGTIIHTVDKKYKIPKVYLPAEKLNEAEKALKFISGSMLTTGVLLKRVNKLDQRLDLLAKFMDLYYSQGGLLMIYGIMVLALEKWRAAKEEKANFDFRLTLKEEMQSFLVPYVENLVTLVTLNLGEVRTSTMLSFVQDFERNFNEWFKTLAENKELLGIGNGKSVSEAIHEVVKG